MVATLPNSPGMMRGSGVPDHPIVSYMMYEGMVMTVVGSIIELKRIA